MTLPTFREAVKTWAYIGCVNFGGPAGQIALMHKIFVEDRKWLGEARFLHALNYCMLLPGPEAQQLATYIGWLLYGVKGGLAAGLLFILPGALVMLILSVLYATLADLSVVNAIFFGIKAAVLAIVVEAIIRLSRRALTSWFSLAIADAAFIAIFFFAVPFPIVVLAAGLTGLIAAQLNPRLFRTAGPSTAAGSAGLIDRLLDAGLLTHTKASARQTLRTVAIWLTIWLAPVLLLAAALPDSVFTKIAVFFSQMSLVTFGGAYAVLAYVAQEAVATYHWLAPGEMMDGLALAETTPGPLILVLQHVGFLAAYREAGFAAGVLGALIALWVLFAPSFLWIFAGAPYAERLRQNRALSAVLAAIAAAVVGVMLSLAVWFALHVVFTSVGEATYGPIKTSLPDWSTYDPWALGLIAISLVALLGLRIPVWALLLGSAILGLAVSFLRV